MAKRWEDLAAVYREEIASGRLSPGDRLPSDAALADLHQVSRATAHRALHELQRQGLVVRQRRWGTVVAEPQKAATGLAALVVDQIARERDFPRADMIQGLHAGLGEARRLVWHDSRLSVDREIENLEQAARETDGIICWPTGQPGSTEVLRRLAGSGFPLVLLDRVPEGLDACAVTNDSVGATEAALDLLISRGHSRIALFTFEKPHVSTVVERRRTYERVLEEHGLPSRPFSRTFHPDLEFGDPNAFVQAVYDSLFTLLKGPEPVTAVFCVQDMLAAAVVDCVESLGVRIPEDLEIAAYNDWPSMMLRRPWQIHRIVTQAHELGRLAGERLAGLIDGSAPAEPRVIRVPAEVVVADAGLMPAFQRPPARSRADSGAHQ